MVPVREMLELVTENVTSGSQACMLLGWSRMESDISNKHTVKYTDISNYKYYVYLSYINLYHIFFSAPEVIQEISLGPFALVTQ